MLILEDSMSSFLKSALMLGLMGTGLSVASDKLPEQERKDQPPQSHPSVEIVLPNGNVFSCDSTVEVPSYDKNKKVPYNPYEDERNYEEEVVRTYTIDGHKYTESVRKFKQKYYDWDYVWNHIDPDTVSPSQTDANNK